MNLIQYLNVIEQFASTDPDLHHDPVNNPAVFLTSPEDATIILEGITDRMVLLLPPYSKTVRNNNAMGNVWLKDGLILALQYAPQGDQEAKNIILSKSEEVLDRLYTFLFNNRNSPLLYGFDPTVWQSDSIGPVGANHYGYFAEFTIKDGVRL
ncbi:hypothetical protein ACR79B_11250 [Sphingobacterium spiritivorum]|uniref:hypothetical protein n=1 Tax=Sphingobacterium spiritivorum TaxID=258 RepID=UPI003DA2C935